MLTQDSEAMIADFMEVDPSNLGNVFNIIESSPSCVAAFNLYAEGDLGLIRTFGSSYEAGGKIRLSTSLIPDNIESASTEDIVNFVLETVHEIAHWTYSQDFPSWKTASSMSEAGDIFVANEVNSVVAEAKAALELGVSYPDVDFSAMNRGTAAVIEATKGIDINSKAWTYAAKAAANIYASSEVAYGEYTYRGVAEVYWAIDKYNSAQKASGLPSITIDPSSLPKNSISVYTVPNGDISITFSGVTDASGAVLNTTTKWITKNGAYLDPASTLSAKLATASVTWEIIGDTAGYIGVGSL